MRYFLSFLTICLSFFAIFLGLKKSVISKNSDNFSKGDAIWVL